MIERVGTCPYCGQNNMVRVNKNASDEEVNRAAGPKSTGRCKVL